MKGSGEGDGEKEEESGGAEEGGYMGDIRMLGEGGREWLFGIWISRQSPPLARAERWRQMWMNLHKGNVIVMVEYTVWMNCVTVCYLKIEDPLSWLDGLWVHRLET